ncbi:MAG: diaminopimelate epimerase [candidate division Zixibacteria bacterium]|nr:diaminopimelate epimerase [candidate division Zixibacteria bacterium]
MLIPFEKYHALRNDFIVIEQGRAKLTPSRLERLAPAICDRRSGVGADGIVYLSSSDSADQKIDIYNADGSWAEKSGNGLRIAGVHMHLKNRKKRNFLFDIGSSIDRVTIIKKIPRGFLIKTELGEPKFEAALVPIKSRLPYLINAPLKVGEVEFPVTCLSVGNPHTVLFVGAFDFDWHTLGADIERHKAFPNRTNVEFVKIISRSKVKVCDWERGAGPTGSSGTGAAAAVCAGVMLGTLDRECDVHFETGVLNVNWSDETNLVELTGPAEHVTDGVFEF